MRYAEFHNPQAAEAPSLQAWHAALLGADHLEELASIEAQCFSSGWSFKQYQSAYAEKWFEAYGIFISGQMAGYITMSIIADELEVLNIAVLKPFRSRGYAFQLMKFALNDSCTRRHWKTAFLEVSDNNIHALALYGKLGFKRSGIRHSYYSDGTNAVCMVLSADIFQVTQI